MILIVLLRCLVNMWWFKLLHLLFSCEGAALEGLTEVSGSQTMVHIVMHLYVPSL